MKKESLNVIKYTVESDFNELYDIFLIPEDNNDSMGFYIQKQGIGLISFALGLQMKDYEQIDNIDNFIDENLDEWISVCELDIKEE